MPEGTQTPVSMVVPVYNEVDNVRPLVEAIGAAMGDKPYEIALVLAGEELVMKGTCEPGPAVVAGCVLLGDAVLDLEVGTKGRFAVERRDAYGNRAPSRQGQLALRCAVDGPGNAEVHVVDEKPTMCFVSVAYKIDSIESAIQTGKRDGMLTLDDDLQRLLTEGRISSETARRFAKDPDGLAPLR